MKKRTKTEIEEDVIAGSKFCRKCGERKSFNLFHNQIASKDGKMSWCKDCNEVQRKKWETSNPNYGRKKHLKAKYSMTEEQYNKILQEQNGVCAICSTDDPGGPWKKFKVDHNHKTGEIRGLLCQHCNVGLGHFKDDVTLFTKAIEYINESRYRLRNELNPR